VASDNCICYYTPCLQTIVQQLAPPCTIGDSSEFLLVIDFLDLRPPVSNFWDPCPVAAQNAEQQPLRTVALHHTYEACLFSSPSTNCTSTIFCTQIGYTLVCILFVSAALAGGFELVDGKPGAYMPTWSHFRLALCDVQHFIDFGGLYLMRYLGSLIDIFVDLRLTHTHSKVILSSPLHTTLRICTYQWYEQPRTETRCHPNET
jgi:hypothetical protein